MSIVSRWTILWLKGRKRDLKTPRISAALAAIAPNFAIKVASE